MDCIESGKIHYGHVSREKGLASDHGRSSNASDSYLQTQYSVDRALNGLQRELGEEGFRKTFKTIMVDHGSEFPDSATLEQSVLSNRPRTTIYDAHPNRSWERGSNENGNGFILTDERVPPQNTGRQVGKCVCTVLFVSGTNWTPADRIQVLHFNLHLRAFRELAS